MKFQNVLGWQFWKIGRFPLFCQYFVDYNQIFIQPEYKDVKVHEQHVDGGINPGFFTIDQDNAAIPVQFFCEH